MTTQEVKSAVLDALKEHREAFHVPDEQHYLDHLKVAQCRAVDEQMRANHEFVSSVRESGKLAGRVSLGLLVTAVVGWLIKVIVTAAK